MDLVFGVGRGGCTSVAEGHFLPSKSIRQSLLEDFFLFCTVGLYSATGSPQVMRQGAEQECRCGLGSP